MANSDTGSRPSGMDHDFLASFLAGEIQQRHLDVLKTAGGGLLFPGGEDWNALELDKDKDYDDEHVCNTTDTDACSSCCDSVDQCASIHPQCDTKIQCHTHHPHCKSHEHECKHKHHAAYQPPRHASWFDRP